MDILKYGICKARQKPDSVVEITTIKLGRCYTTYIYITKIVLNYQQSKYTSIPFKYHKL